MQIAMAVPDLEVSLDLGPYAPRLARHYVAQVDRPSPDLRDAVSLLTSELVTRAVQQDGSSAGKVGRLRIWMPADVVRVELWTSRELLTMSSELLEPHYDQLLLSQIADRWATDIDALSACMWFEIDRHGPVGDPEPRAHHQRRESTVERRPFIRRSRRTTSGVQRRGQ
jgi:hypothetical protein